MFSRSHRPSTIQLPLYNSPFPSPRLHHVGRNLKTRYMALGVITFLVCVTLFAFTRAMPLSREKSQWNNSSPSENALIKMRKAATFQSNIEAMTEIYHGGTEVSRDNINHLIIVTGHAILLDESNHMSDEAWVLESFQKGGQVNTFIEHIHKGLELTKNDDRSLLVFSGYGAYYLELMVEVKHVHWLGREVRDNRIGI
jgi:hypothetical protein